MAPSKEFDVSSRAYLTTATERACLRQAEMISESLMPLERRNLNLSIRSDRRTHVTGPTHSLNPLAASPSLSLTLHQSPPSSRDDHHIHGHDTAVEDLVLSRLTSIRSARTSIMPLRPHQEQPNSGLSLFRLPPAATSQHDTVAGRSPRADLRDKTCPTNGHGAHSSMEHRSSMSRKLSQRADDHATMRRMRAEEGSSSARHLKRLGSGVSLGMTTSRPGSERVGRGRATPRHSSSTSSSNEVATIRSRIGPHRQLTERGLRRVELEEEATSQRRREDDEVSSTGWSSGMARQMSNRTESGSISSSGSASSSRLTVSPAWSASASSYSSSPVWRRGYARQAYASSEVSDLLSRRRRRRRERKERREGGLRRLTRKIATVFLHHRHDHHHHHHHRYKSDREEDNLPMSDRRVSNRKSARKNLGGLFHRTKGQDKKRAASKTTTVSVPAKKGGVLFGAMRHLHRKEKAPASVQRRKMASRMQAHWWQRLWKRRGQPRRRLGHAGNGKAATL